MLINFNEEKIIENIIQENISESNIYLKCIYESIIEDVKNWLANYGLYSEISNEIIKKLKNMNIKVIY